MLQLAPSSHVQHPQAAHKSHGSIPQSRCRIEFSHEYDTLCSCRTEEWPSFRKVYIKKIKKTSKSKAEVDLVYGTTSHIYSSSGFFWYTQNWFMFIQLFYCNCLQFKLAFESMTEFFDAFFWMNDWLSNVYSHKSLPRHYAEQGNVGSLLLSLTLFAAFIKPKMGFHYWTQLDAHIKKYHSVYKQKPNEFPFEREMQSSVFNEF